MKRITTTTAFGAMAATAGLVIVGIAGPAMADDASSEGSSATYTQQRWYERTDSSYNTQSPFVVAPQVGDVDVLGGGILSGDIGNGTELNAPVGSGNETAIGNNNDTPIVSGNTTDVSDVGTVTDAVDNVTDTSVDDLVDSVIDDSVSDLVDVDDLVGDVTSGVDLDSMFED